MKYSHLRVFSYLISKYTKIQRLLNLRSQSFSRVLDPSQITKSAQ